MTRMLLFCNETQHPRYHYLCSLLEAHGIGEVHVRAGLLTWLARWHGQLGIDSGVWFGTSLNEIGGWAATGPDPLTWGRALLEAEYIQDTRLYYPEPLGGAEVGMVALHPNGMPRLDMSFGMLASRRDGRKLVAYISDREKRCHWARKLHVDGTEPFLRDRVPPGWFDLPSPQACLTRPRGGRKANRAAGDGSQQSPGEGAGDAVVAPGESSGSRQPHAPGNRDGEDLLTVVRACYRTDPLAAMQAIDPSAGAMVTWGRAVRADASAVVETLHGMVSDRNAWDALRNPAAVLNAAIRNRGILKR